MSEFKVGDIVECVNYEDWSDIERGKVLKVVEGSFDNTGKNGFIHIMYVEDWPEDFKLVTEEVKEEAEETKQDLVRSDYSLKHYDTFYHLTDKDIEEGKIKIDAYFVAKQWKVGSKDDSGALFHNLKTIARFGEKNSIEREIKALYNQTLALARIYNVELH